MRYTTVSVDVDVDFDDLDTDDLIDELKSRGYMVNTEESVSQIDEECISLIREIYEKRRTGEDYKNLLDSLIYNVLGKIL
jgi:hypothetical protein